MLEIGLGQSYKPSVTQCGQEVFPLYDAVMLKGHENFKMLDFQLGSRRGKSSQTPILMEILQQDISRLTRRSYGQINYDAKAFYDRILPNLASIVSDAFGVPKSIVKLHNHLLHNMKYCVTVPRSQKEWNYFHTTNHPVYGTGQGSGNSPHVWTMISSVILQLLNKEAQGAQYRTHNNMIYKMVSTAYVDDVNTHHTTENVIPGGLISSMSEDFSRWEEILEARGGKLAPEKCSYYSMGWKFSRGGKPEMIDATPKEQDDIHHSFVTRRILA